MTRNVGILAAINSGGFPNIAVEGMASNDIFGYRKKYIYTKEAVDEVDAQLNTDTEATLAMPVEEVEDEGGNDDYFGEVPEELKGAEVSVFGMDETDGIPATGYKSSPASANPEDCLNIMEIVGTYTNSYRKCMTSIMAKHISLIEKTGDITKHPKYKEYEMCFKQLDVVVADSIIPMYVNLKAAWTLLNDAPKMSAICGTAVAPFLYEGFSLAVLQQLHSFMAIMPHTFSRGCPIMDNVESSGMKDSMSLTDKVLSDFVNCGSVLGNKIIFLDATIDEVTNKKTEINNTPYADSEILNGSMDDGYPDGDSNPTTDDIVERALDNGAAAMSTPSDLTDLPEDAEIGRAHV